MKLILGLLVVTPLVLLVVGTIRGRVQVRSCCAVPAEHDARLSSAYAETAPRGTVQDVQTAATERSAH